jgi:hypothetical protein
MTNDDPIFRSVSHALHVSFLIISQPATAKSPTSIVIDMLVKQNHVWDGIPPERESRVNFRGLSPLEVRAQCAQVVSMVNHLPHAAERDAICAIYGQQFVKSVAVRGLTSYVEPMLAPLSLECCLYVAWNVFCTKAQREGISLADIAKEFGYTNEAVRHAKNKVEELGRCLHARACGALEPRFIDGGLIDSC